MGSLADLSIQGWLPQSTIGPTFFLSTQCLVSGYCACPESQFVIISYLSAAVEPLQRSVRRSGVLVLVAVQERRSVASASHILLLSKNSRTSAETDRAANGLACPACDVAVVAKTHIQNPAAWCCFFNSSSLIRTRTHRMTPQETSRDPSICPAHDLDQRHPGCASGPRWSIVSLDKASSVFDAEHIQPRNRGHAAIVTCTLKPEPAQLILVVVH